MRAPGGGRNGCCEEGSKRKSGHADSFHVSDWRCPESYFPGHDIVTRFGLVFSCFATAPLLPLSRAKKQRVSRYHILVCGLAIGHARPFAPQAAFWRHFSIHLDVATTGVADSVLLDAACPMGQVARQGGCSLKYGRLVPWRSPVAEHQRPIDLNSIGDSHDKRT